MFLLLGAERPRCLIKLLTIHCWQGSGSNLKRNFCPQDLFMISQTFFALVSQSLPNLSEDGI